MGLYVYRVTAQRVKCSDGKPANIAVYAYKPYWSWDSEKENARLHFRTGCHASERLAREGKLSDRVVIGEKTLTGKYATYPDCAVYENPHHRGVFSDDDNLGVEGRMPVVNDVTVPQAQLGAILPVTERR